MADSTTLFGIGSHLQVNHVYPEQLELDEDDSPRPMSSLSGLYSEKLFSRSPSRGVASSASKTPSSATTARKEHTPGVRAGTVSPVVLPKEEKSLESRGGSSPGKPVTSNHLPSTLGTILAELDETCPSIAMARFQGETHRHERFAIGSLPASPNAERNLDGTSSLSISLFPEWYPEKTAEGSPVRDVASQGRTRKRTWEGEDGSNVSSGNNKDWNKVMMHHEGDPSDLIAVDQSEEGEASQACAADLVFRLTRQPRDPTGLRPRVHRPGKCRKRPKKVEEDQNS
ncbi:uncharacterized protein E0L32_003955 [Thyridium curvatum]|uniref:Uncharacterized protein n=1 Tax=Thyridium curvatum TaxID=1093900 RepID=A0A507BAQ5_9PEZI|nr:uncharacterized protein E0L32_003955 [Thyridium curvatum]TPX16306.1 hypothetical protein E0L32_003955 [Thyridium curvatum]